MKKQPQPTKEDEITNFMFEKKDIYSKERESLINNTLSEEDKKIVFLLENNLLSQIGKLENSGIQLKDCYKKEYHVRLYENLINNPNETLREYLKSKIELPEKFQEIYFLMDIQSNSGDYRINFSKIYESFVSRVKNALSKDYLEKYKYKKINDKNFVNDLFDFWYESHRKHINDIQRNVMNKKKFLFFTYNKSGEQLVRDVTFFKENGIQKHIVRATAFFKVLLRNEFFFQHVDMDKILKAKELLKSYEKIQKDLNKYKSKTINTFNYEAKLLNDIEINDIMKMFERAIKTNYEKSYNEIVREITSSKEEKLVDKEIVKDLLNVVNKELVYNLPSDSASMIEEIKNKAENLYKKNLNEETKEIIVFLLEEKLPEVINKYLLIDKEYRESLKNVQGKSAKELMMDSLVVINESVECIEKDINEENLTNLSIHNRYIKRTLKR